jgi:hypothetical protein
LTPGLTLGEAVYDPPPPPPSAVITSNTELLPFPPLVFLEGDPLPPAPTVTVLVPVVIA